MRERCMDPMDPERLQDPDPEKTDRTVLELYHEVAKQLREDPFDEFAIAREKLERVYDLLNTCDPMFYAPTFRKTQEEDYWYDPIREYQAVYRELLIRIYGMSEMDDGDVAGSISRNTQKIAYLFETDYKSMLEPYCLAKGIQYSCNIFGIRCSLITGSDGAMYAVSEIDQEKVDRFGLKRTESVLNRIVKAVTDYLDEREYEYDLQNTVFMDRIIHVRGEGVAFRFRYLEYLDICQVKVIFHRSLREKFGDDLWFSEENDARQLSWETDFDMSSGIDGLMKGIERFLPEGGMPDTVAGQVDVLRKIVAQAEKAFEEDDDERLNRLIELAGDENEKLDRICELTGFPYIYVGNVPQRLYGLLQEMGLFDGEEGYDGEEDDGDGPLQSGEETEDQETGTGLWETVFGGSGTQNPEMDRLKALLDEAGIPYRTRKGILGGEMLDYCGTADSPVPLLNVISDGYGSERGLLEAQGFGWDSVGDLTADEIFEKIREDYEKRR